MSKRPTSLGLDDFGLTLNSLRKLGDRRVTILIHFPYPTLRKLLPFSPSDRKRMTDEILNKCFDKFSTAWGKYIQKHIGSRRRKSGALVIAPADVIRNIASHPLVDSAWVSAIDGIRRRRSDEQSLCYFCVRGIYAIEIEGETRGLQGYEERFVLVKARSFADAERIVRRDAKGYATPYLNPNGQLVRWRLEKVVDVYDTAECSVPEGCFEVYSELRNRRMKPSNIWKPRGKLD